MAKKWKPRVDVNDPKNAMIVKLANEVRAEVVRRRGTELTFEKSRDAAAEIMAEALWVDTDTELQSLATDDDEIEIGGIRYTRLEQNSSAVYYGRWGSHEVKEPLYREAGVYNGATLKPVERRVGMIARRMTPDLGRIIGELSADGNSREIERTMRAVGMRPPSRSFLEKRMTQMATEIAECVEELEEYSRAAQPLSDEIASLSCGMDRMSVRMSEPHPEPETAPLPRRDKPYERTPPPPKEHNYRMALVGTATAYNKDKEPLHTWRYALDAGSSLESIARRVSADIAHLMAARPELPVTCVQDGAPELRLLPKKLREVLPVNTNITELIDFEHLLGYLDKVVAAFEPEGDPQDMKGWYRHELLRDDDAIDRIWRKLKDLERTLPKDATEAQQNAVAAALSYIGKRKDNMRYASHYAAKLTIGSGTTEGTCSLMQKRVKRRGQSWEPSGLRAIMTIRGLVLSDRWDTAWQAYAATHRSEVRNAA